MISIVIRACNEEQHIGQLLDGISHQTLPDHETILVDSGSTDRTLEIAASYQVRVVHIQPDEFTFGYSLNQGISQSHGELVVIASAHVYPVYPDWLECLLKPFNDSQVALTYGKQRGNSSNKFSEQQIFHHWYPEHSQPHQPYPFCNNANAAIRRSVWESLRYDETLPGLEDLAWAHQVMAQGHAISYVAEAEVVHIHDETPRAVYNRYRVRPWLSNACSLRSATICGTWSTTWLPTSPVMPGRLPTSINWVPIWLRSAGFAGCSSGVPTGATANRARSPGSCARPFIIRAWLVPRQPSRTARCHPLNTDRRTHP
jgi:GT2 family glycosyltransferase